MKALKFAVVAFATLILTNFALYPGIGFTQGGTICDHCKARAHCSKVCHLVCKEKNVEVTCWGCECEEFCVLGPSTPNCEHCKELKCSCGEGLNAKVVSKSKAFSCTSWLPGGASTCSEPKNVKPMDK